MAIRRLWLEALSDHEGGSEATTYPRAEAHSEYETISRVVKETQDDDSAWLSDVLFLALRGYYLSSIEDPERWQSERAIEALERLLDLVDGRD